MLRYMTAGESHGKALVVILDGVPAGLTVDEAFIDNELIRRMSGYGRGGRMAIEKDKADIISGKRKGKTIGSPVSILIANRDHKIEELPDVYCPRPGHADLAGILKYGLNDARDVLERASARETAARVAAGAVCKLLLRELGISVFGHVLGIGKVEASEVPEDLEALREKAEKSEVRCADGTATAKMKEEIDKASDKGDTLGGVFEIVVTGMPPGLGSYTQWDKRLDGMLARALMSIQAVKAVSIGNAINAASETGSRVHDPIAYDKGKRGYSRPTNNCGGLEGGVSNGEPVMIRGYMKPIATLKEPLDTVDVRTGKSAKASTERSDVTAVPACAVIGESVTAIEIASACLSKFGSDSISEIKHNFEAYQKRLKDLI